MKIRHLLALAAAFAWAPYSPTLAAPADEPAAAQPQSRSAMQLRGGQWFDGEKFAPMEWYVVNGRLTRERPAAPTITVDLDGRWIVPPLAEAHNHDLQNAYFAGMKAPRYVRQGIFYSAQFCAHPEGISQFRAFLGQAATPDVLFAEACITSSHGHPLGIALASSKAAGMEVEPDEFRNKSFWSIDSQADLDLRWPQIAESQTTLVKVILIDAENHAANSSDPDLFGYNGIDPALLPEIVSRSHAMGARVAVHVDTAGDFAIAVAAGADMIAHLPGYRIAKGKVPADYRIAEAAIAEAARRGTAVITTTAAARYAIKANPETSEPILANYTDNLTRLIAAGVPILTGSDAIDGSVVDELKSLDRLAVLSRARLLAIATNQTPRYLFPGRDIGTFAEGAEASLVVLASDPLTDLSAFDSPALVIKQGVLLPGG